jgi:LPLT family lysophospholipid transporter-like MFS transporter
MFKGFKSNMNRLRPLTSLLITQFMSAFADNMILFIILEILKQKGIDSKYLVVIGIAFLLPYVILAPIVGSFADKNPKSKVLFIGNLIKCIGIFVLLLGFVHIIDLSIQTLLICYFIVGTGAVVYSPAKYGILPELSRTQNELLKANAQIEGFTIMAIIAGTVLGGIIAGISVLLSIIVCLALYGISIYMARTIPTVAGNKNINYVRSIFEFFVSLKSLLSNEKTKFSLIGTGAFWKVAYVLRTAIILWIPIHLAIQDTGKISMISGLTAIGIVAGSLLSPYLIPLNKFYKCYIYGFIMAFIILLFPLIHSFSMTVILLLLVGFMGGVFIIPMNTVLQETGSKMVGSGITISIQNFVENILMVIGALIFYFITSVIGGSVDVAIIVMGVILLLFVVYLQRTSVLFKKH